MKRFEDEVLRLCQHRHLHAEPRLGSLRHRKREEITSPLAPPSRRTAWFENVEVTPIDLRERFVEDSTGTKTAYDYLVIATGPKLDYDGVKGLGPKRFTHAMFAPRFLGVDPVRALTEITTQAGSPRCFARRRAPFLRRDTRSSVRAHAHWAKLAFEKYFLATHKRGHV